MRPKKIVLDTNVIIGAIAFGGPCQETMLLWEKGQVELCLSRLILAEYSNIISKYFGDDNAIRMILQFQWRPNVINVIPRQHFDIVKDDPSDNIFIDCAVMARADYIITQDKHLLKIREFRKIKIVRPDKFLEIISKEQKKSGDK